MLCNTCLPARLGRIGIGHPTIFCASRTCLRHWTSIDVSCFEINTLPIQSHVVAGIGGTHLELRLTSCSSSSSHPPGPRPLCSLLRFPLSRSLSRLDDPDDFSLSLLLLDLSLSLLAGVGLRLLDGLRERLGERVRDRDRDRESYSAL